MKVPARDFEALSSPRPQELMGLLANPAAEGTLPVLGEKGQGHSPWPSVQSLSEQDSNPPPA